MALVSVFFVRSENPETVEERDEIPARVEYGLNSIWVSENILVGFVVSQIHGNRAHYMESPIFRKYTIRRELYEILEMLFASFPVNEELCVVAHAEAICSTSHSVVVIPNGLFLISNAKACRSEESVFCLDISRKLWRGSFSRLNKFVHFGSLFCIRFCFFLALVALTIRAWPNRKYRSNRIKPHSTYSALVILGLFVFLEVVDT